jgi:hypothetical protein
VNERYEDVIKHYAAHPEIWNKIPRETTDNTPSKTYIARGFGTTVEELEARIAAAAAEFARSRAVSLKPIDTREATNITWLFTGRYPAGMLVILDGDPGLSKSMFSLGLTVSVITGKPFLGMIKPETTGGVILLSAEDDLNNTIIPRLLAAGAPLGVIPNLHHIPCTKPGGDRISLADVDTLAALEKLIIDTKARLMVVDPINAYLGDKVDSNNDQKIRQVLGPISEMANRTGCMIFCLRHLNKGGGGKAIYRGLGSIGYTGQARANFFAAQHPDDEGWFVIAASKFNIGAKPSSIKYTLDFATVPNVSSPVPYCARGENCDLTANALSAQSDDDGDKVAEAVEFLQEILSLGPVSFDLITKAAAKRKIATITLRRAKSRMKVKSVKTTKNWYWQLPDDKIKAQDCEDAVDADAASPPF